MVPPSSRADASELLSHAAWIRELARRLVRDDASADDLVQETWLAALRHGPDSSRSLRPWLARVLRNFALQARRKRSVRPAVEHELEELAQASPSPADLLARGEVQARLVTAVLGLRDPYRSTLLLRFYEGLTPKEIARAQRVPDATVRSRLKRAIEELRVRLDSVHGGDHQAWLLAFVPFVGANPSMPAALAMKSTSTKLVAALGAFLLVLFGGFRVWSAFDAPRADPSRSPTEMRPPASVPGASVVSARDAANAPSLADVVRTAPPDVETTPTVLEGRWVGVLVDDESGAPLPDFLIEIRQGARRERVTSGATGYFETKKLYENGPLQVWFRDHPAMERDAIMRLGAEAGSEEPTEVWETRDFDARSDGPPGIEIPVRVGPTFELVFSRHAGFDPADLELRASVVGAGDHFRSALGRYVAAPVRDGADLRGPWVRFAELPDALEHARPWRLGVYSRDGLWFGEARIKSISRWTATSVRVRMDALGRVSGVVRDARGTVASADVRIEPLAPHENRGASMRVVTDSGGRYALEWVPPGNYRLVVESFTHHEWSEKQRVRRLETHARDIELSMFSLLDEFEWTPRSLVLEPPLDGVRFEVADDARTFRCSFEVVDAATGAVLPVFSVGYSTNGGTSLQLEGMSAGAHQIDTLPEDASVEWAIHVAGYASAFGDETAFEFDGWGDAAVRVRMHRGWRARVVVSNADSGERVAGAEVSVDGHIVGHTDGAGRLVVYRTEAPIEIEASYGGRRGRVDDPTRRLPSLRVQLR